MFRVLAPLNHSVEGLMLEMSVLKLLQWLIYLINLLDNTKLPCTVIISHQCSTKVNLET